MPERQPHLESILRYHERTKHHLGKFARSPGFMDWSTQPEPFRHYLGAPHSLLDEVQPQSLPSFDDIYRVEENEAAPLSKGFLSQFFYDSLALSAWKALGRNQWSLRCNPSSGNLHPTEGYLIVGPEAGLDQGGLFHYSPLLHALELRSKINETDWEALVEGLPSEAVLVGLTSIHWRESWKYGERAYRYCQLDVGHAVAALSYAAAALGWQAQLLEGVSDVEISHLLGVHLQEGPEREHADCILVLAPSSAAELEESAKRWSPPPQALEKIAVGMLDTDWNTLSPDHRSWPIIDEAAEACQKPTGAPHVGSHISNVTSSPWSFVERSRSARGIMRQRRSAVDMDGTTWLDSSEFFRMLSSVTAISGRPPLSTLPWTPAIDLALFVHRVRGLEPGLYVLLRQTERERALRQAFNDEFLWEQPEEVRRVAPELPLFLLEGGDARRLAETISCGQEIASHGAFAASMVAEFLPRLEEQGAWFYRRLFWEAGAIGHILYLEAEAAGVGATGIGCYLDDAMHELLGLGESKTYQTLYHLTVGGPVEDDRLRTIPAYAHREELLARLSS